MASVTFDRVNKVYDDGTEAVKGLDLTISDGEFLVLVGPSGCGKTTALRMLAGLETVSSGAILLAGKRINDTPPQRRDVAMVFQNYALYPQMTVEENLAFGLRAHGMPKTQSRDRVLAVAAALGLTDYLTRRPRFLSGGQRQRVAMGRAIAREPSVFLMDEPLSNLDAKLRVQMRAEIMRIQRRLGTTTVYVTHDQTEALTMGDRIAVMRNGILQQVGTPYEVYESPANLFVAEFIGSPSMNLASGRIRLVDGLVSFEIGAHRWELPESVTRMYPSLLERDGQEIILGIRPENVGLVTSVPHGDAIRMATTAELVESVGSDVYVHFSIEAPPVQSLELIEIARDIGASGVEKLAESAGQTEFIARCPAEVNIQAGQAITLVMRSERIHFFDRDSGDAVRRSVERIQS